MVSEINASRLFIELATKLRAYDYEKLNGNKHYEDISHIKHDFELNLTALIKQEALKMLPKEDKPRMGSENQEHYRVWGDGFNRCLFEAQQNISNYTIERRGK